MSDILYFIKSLDTELQSYPDSNIVFFVEKGRQNFTNAVLLLGCYMILRENLSPRKVMSKFARLDTALIVPYREANNSEYDFTLSIFDCWQGLEQGKLCGWVNFSYSPTMWGKINLSFYRGYASPANGDMHQVVPGKFIAFKGPIDLGPSPRQYRDTSSGERIFSPCYYVDVFAEIGVIDVIRLNEPRYDAVAFTSRGLRHHDLAFADGAYPPEDVLAALFRVVDTAAGAIAVHCRDGLRQTATLIALCLMRSHAFTAREAIAWLRMMRPGSVVGEQQDYLCEVSQILDERAAGKKLLSHAVRG